MATFFFLGVFFLRTLLPKVPATRLAVLIMLFPIWLINFPFSGLTDMTLLAWHFGCVVLTTMLLIIILMKIQSSKSVLWKTLFSIIFILSGFSDPLVILFIVVPAIFALCLGIYFAREYWKNFAKLIIGFLLLSLVTFILYKYIPLPIHQVKVAKHLSLSNLSATLSLYHGFFTHSPILSPLWLAFFPCALNVLLSKKYNNRVDGHIALICLTLLFQAPIVFLLIFLNASGMPPAWRYVQPNAIMIVFIGWPLLLYKILPQVFEYFSNINRYVTVIVVLTLSALPRLGAHPMLTLHGILSYYPPEVACADQLVKKYNLTNGLGGYWVSQPISMFSRTGTIVGSYLFDWNNYKGDYRHADYNYAIVRKDHTTYLADSVGPPASGIRNIFGRPDEVVPFCSMAGMEVYIYRNGQINKFLKKNKNKIQTPSISFLFHVYKKGSRLMALT